MAVSLPSLSSPHIKRSCLAPPRTVPPVPHLPAPPLNLRAGYLNTCSFLLAPTLVPPGQKARASGLMTVAFQSACFGALMLAYAVQQLELSTLVAHVVRAAGVVAH